MSNIKKILIPGFIPAPTSFGSDEIIINPIDGKIYIKNAINNTLRVVNQDKDNNTPLDGDILINKKIEFKETKNSDSILFISSSNNQSRIGIGTANPKSNIDFKAVEDATTGTEIVLRTARTTRGALTGDEGGSINFTIDSGSFNDLKTSGSLAKIKTKVTDIGVGGARGKLAFELSKTAGGETKDIFEYGFNIGGETLFTAIQTASLIIKDFSATGPSIVKMVDFDNTINFQVLEGNITASGDISSSGNIIGIINGGTF